MKLVKWSFIQSNLCIHPFKPTVWVGYDEPSPMSHTGMIKREDLAKASRNSLSKKRDRLMAHVMSSVEYQGSRKGEL